MFGKLFKTRTQNDNSVENTNMVNKEYSAAQSTAVAETALTNEES